MTSRSFSFRERMVFGVLLVFPFFSHADLYACLEANKDMRYGHQAECMIVREPKATFQNVSRITVDAFKFKLDRKQTQTFQLADDVSVSLVYDCIPAQDETTSYYHDYYPKIDVEVTKGQSRVRMNDILLTGVQSEPAVAPGIPVSSSGNVFSIENSNWKLVCQQLGVQYGGVNILPK